jgi:hypothetical protein
MEPVAAPSCGNDWLDPCEQCDEGGVDTAECDRDCTLPACDDGVLNQQAGEVCEPPGAAGCNATCDGIDPSPGCTDPTTCLKVEHLNFNPTPEWDTIYPWLKVVNNSATAVPFSELTLRYWFTFEGSGTLVPHCDWGSLLSTTWSNDCQGLIHLNFVTLAQPKFQATHYLEVSFTGTTILNPSPGPGQTGESTNELQLRFHTTNWTLFTQTNDHSYGTTANHSAFADSVTVTAYRNGTLIWGTEP